MKRNNDWETVDIFIKWTNFFFACSSWIYIFFRRGGSRRGNETARKFCCTILCLAVASACQSRKCNQRGTPATRCRFDGSTLRNTCLEENYLWCGAITGWRTLRRSCERSNSSYSKSSSHSTRTLSSISSISTLTRCVLSNIHNIIRSITSVINPVVFVVK